MDVGGGYVLTEKQDQEWRESEQYGSEYQEYIDAGLYNPTTRELLDAPEWMIDGDPMNGPFDFSLSASQETIGW